jgi:hypothetical protein
MSILNKAMTLKKMIKFKIRKKQLMKIIIIYPSWPKNRQTNSIASALSVCCSHLDDRKRAAH